MKLLITSIAIGSLGLCLVACGGTNAVQSASQPPSTGDVTKASAASTTPTSAFAPAPVKTTTDADADNDVGVSPEDKSNNEILDFGHEADRTDKQAITALMRRYYVAAATENGAKACAMLYSTVAEAVAEDVGDTTGQPYMKGTTCPIVMTLLFKHYHPQLALELPKLKIARVRIVEHHAKVVLHFGSLPEREMIVKREGHTWRINTLLDNEIP